MNDEIAALTDALTRDPGSLAFLELGEMLRRRGEFEAAVGVSLSGLEHHPDLLEAHDLYARILADVGDVDRAWEVWEGILAREPRHVGALKGLGFLSFGAGDLDSALDRLELALAADPTDPTVVQALMTARAAAEGGVPVGSPELADPVFAGLDGAEQGILLVDERGQVLGGGVADERGEDVSEKSAAFLAGAAREAERTARLLDMGYWRWVAAESSGGNVHLSAPAEGSLLMIVRDRSVPSGRLAMLAARAAEAARTWLWEQQL
jgi:tetratricopeptide (TPR) repeat protein